MSFTTLFAFCHSHLPQLQYPVSSVIVVAAHRLTHLLSESYPFLKDNSHSLTFIFLFISFHIISILFSATHPLSLIHFLNEPATKSHNNYSTTIILSEADYWGIFSNFTRVPCYYHWGLLLQTAISDMKWHTFLRESGCSSMAFEDLLGRQTFSMNEALTGAQLKWVYFRKAITMCL